ncbi:MAG TPA: hypothetical protein VLJ42_02700 [Solirubrobacteraceae bacterium]|nr:hypothetical protein [Solirubrobacteraceae bacterium]
MLVTGAAFIAGTSAAQAAFGVASFTANVVQSDGTTLETQAGSHPFEGYTTFTLNTVNVAVPPAPPLLVPDGNVRNIRVDVPAGLTSNPQALPQCTDAQLATLTCPVESQVGTQALTVFNGTNDVPIRVPLYNMVPPDGHPADFAFSALGSRGDVMGNIRTDGDYGVYYTIHVAAPPAAPPVISSTLTFWGVPADAAHDPQRGETCIPINVCNGGGLSVSPSTPHTPFLTNPTLCGPPLTTRLTVDSYQDPATEVTADSTTPTGTLNCDVLPFSPSILVTPDSKQSDTATGVGVDLTVPQSSDPGTLGTAHLKKAVVTLPAGTTINPAAAGGNLAYCKDADLGIGTTNPANCPALSVLGTVSIATPLLPTALTGSIYLGGPADGSPIKGGPYKILLDAESARYGVSVRLAGTVAADPDTGQLTATFDDNPQVPFSLLSLHFNAGAHSPLANPLVCGAANTTSTLTPYSGEPAATPTSTFNVDFDNNLGACPSPLPFALTQSTAPQNPSTAGAYSPFVINFARADGQQYLSKVRAVLPPGLLGAIPSVPLCADAQASQGTCDAASKVGDVSITAGAGSDPYPFTGPVYLTGPYNGAPYGLSIAVPAKAGPFDLGTVVTRARIDVDQLTGRVIVTSSLPTIVAGIPLRLRTLSIAVNRPNYFFNPTNCGVLSTDTTLTSTLGSTQNLSTPFQVSGCGGLTFKPSFSASSSARTSRANGASLLVKITQGAKQSNIHSVFVQLPKQLPSRLTTIQQACPDTTFNVNPGNCPVGSRVGGATAVTPVLPGHLSGPAYLVAHGGAAFPDLDLILDGSGVRVILVGAINISSAGITTTNFAALPDVPISSVSVNLPVGSHSALTSNGSLCSSTLVMPTTIVGQNGVKITQKTKIAVAACPPKVTKRAFRGHTARITLKTPAAGRVSGSGANLKFTKRSVSKAKSLTLVVPLSRAGVARLNRHGSLKVRVRIGFIPKQKGPTSKTSTTVTIRR